MSRMQRVADAVVAHIRGGRDEGRHLMRALVADLAGVDPASVRIVQRCPDCGGPHGRPVVMDPPAARSIAVSLAHAGEMHIAAAMRGGRLGVDAEAREARPGRVEALGLLLASSDGDLLRRWTQVEAVLKADGRGLRVEPSTVVVDASVRPASATVPGASRRYHVHEVELGGGLVVSLAIEA